MTLIEAEEWLRDAKSDLDLAKVGKVTENICWETLCYHCQQAAEKSLKSLCILRGIKFSRKGEEGHKIEQLILAIEQNGIFIPEEIKNTKYFYGGFTFPFKFPFNLGETISLTDNAIKTRYAGEHLGKYLPLDEGAYKNALTKANNIVVWVEGQFLNE